MLFYYSYERLLLYYLHAMHTLYIEWILVRLANLSEPVGAGLAE